MLLNQDVAVHTSKVNLVPYSEHHVARYHDWMKDLDIQAATASDPLTLEQEYDMQRSWRTDTDKLTFISCFTQPPKDKLDSRSLSRDEELQSLIGDVNLFVLINDEDDASLSLVGELELMIARKDNQRQGYGRAALIVFIAYILKHEGDILKEYFSKPRDIKSKDKFDYLRVKINEGNARSIHLFETLIFKKTETTPNFFDEYELRTYDVKLETVEKWLEERAIQDYTELRYSLSESSLGPEVLQSEPGLTSTAAKKTSEAEQLGEKSWTDNIPTHDKIVSAVGPPVEPS